MDNMDQVIEKLCDLSKSMLTKDESLDHFELDESFVSESYIQYLKYKDSPDAPHVDILLDYYITSSALEIQSSIQKCHIHYPSKYPELYNASKEFLNWYFFTKMGGRRGTGSVTDVRKIMEIDFPSTIHECINNDFPNIKIVKRKTGKYTATFAIDAHTKPKSNVIVSFVTSPVRGFFSLEIGLSKPLFLIDVGELMAQGQSRFRFNDTDSLEFSARKAVKFLRFLVPKFQEIALDLTQSK